jgi:hypothetical protein
MPVPAQRITVDAHAAVGNVLDFFVATGSLETPIATLADNNRFPSVRALYARAMALSGQNGIHVTVVLDAAANGLGLAVNIYQPDMVGDFTVVPRPNITSFNANFFSINILNTRSRGEDTVWVSMAVKVGGKVYTAGPVDAGDHNNGMFNPGVVIGGLPIPNDASPVKTSIVVMNLGNSNGQGVIDLATDIVEIGADAILPGAGDILNAVTTVFGGLIFPNCDGPCILRADLATGAQIWGTVPSYLVQGSDSGYDSPAGCGSNSIYQYAVSFDPA